MSDTKIRLINVDSGGNHNKFWFADIDGSAVVRRWGRVGNKGQSKTFTYYSETDAIWRTQEVADRKIAKGYRTLDIVEDGETVAVGAVNLKQVAAEEIDADAEVLKDLIDYLVLVNVHQITSTTSITYSDGKLRTALGVIGRDAVRQARNALDRIEQEVETGGDSWMFTRRVEDYLTLVPMKLGARGFSGKSVFPNVKAVRKQRQLLDALESVLDAADNGDQDAVTKERARVFDLKVSEVSAEELKHLKRRFVREINGKHVTASMRVKQAWCVEIGGQSEIADNRGNVKELWHGTNAGNLLSILKGGMRVRPAGAKTTGGMFGIGLYFSDQSTKALNYATGFWGGKSGMRKFVLLCAVSLGKTWTPTAPGRPCPSSYDSTFAKGGVSGVLNNEMVVSSEKRVMIKYLVECA